MIDNIVEPCLGILRMRKSQAAKNLKDKIESTLNVYEIGDKIVSITTNGGANVRKCVSELDYPSIICAAMLCI